jgi:hypothetical protein
MDYSPIIIVAAEKHDFESFAQFQQKTMAAPLNVDQTSVTFRPPQSADTIRFFPESARMPEVNGKPVDITPPYWIESPFIRSKWGSGTVTINFGDQTIVRDLAH